MAVIVVTDTMVEVTEEEVVEVAVSEEAVVSSV